MLFLMFFISIFFAAFFYCQALMGGLGLKRWAFAGFMFGPLIWPMFSMKKRMKVARQFGFSALIIKA
jgi:hypothetical protein